MWGGMGYICMVCWQEIGRRRKVTCERGDGRGVGGKIMGHAGVLAGLWMGDHGRKVVER